MYRLTDTARATRDSTDFTNYTHVDLLAWRRPGRTWINTVEESVQPVQNYGPIAAIDPQPGLSGKTMPHLAPKAAAGGGAQAPVGVGQQLGDG